MNKKKISLENLNVKSFSTEFKPSKLKGGASGYAGGLCTGYDCSLESLCNVCEGTEEASNCCPPIK
ncbi:hypothetical protein AB9P05_18860 [Roseivirga sp. BDSF3-8]|uniref:hypothetical protein n=1 Tax=Roseivirga sp. BDSF3-8 TaxID=3241598 RepID=UPI003531A601